MSGIQAGNNLNHSEALAHPVSDECLKILWPMQAVAEPHPPGVAQPEERCSVLVLEVKMIRRHPDRPMFQRSIVPGIFRDDDLALLIVEIRIGRVI